MFSRYPGRAGSLLNLGPGAGFQVPRFSSQSPGSNLYSTNPLQEPGFELSSGRTVLDKKHGIIRISRSGKRWESIVGLEIHTQIQSNSKLFSSAPNLFNQPVNSQVSYFDAAVPGTLPVLNTSCVSAGIRTSLALGAKINLISYFDRKHYFYADLPAGYQITQYRKPISQGGALSFSVRNEEIKKTYTKSSNLVQIQIEQDSGKSLHDEKAGSSLIDLNRCGVGLLELVFAPDLQSGEEAASLAKELNLILQTISVSRGRMERGEMRVDANISVRELGDNRLGTRTEIKNLNSLRSVSRAVEYEVWRQINLIEDGEIVENETRGFDFDARSTHSMRDKERKQDYRFMPEPNLPPLRLRAEQVEGERANLPELPQQTRLRLQEYGVTEEVSFQLVDKPQLLNLFNSCVEYSPKNYKSLASIILLVVQEYLSLNSVNLISTPLDPESLVTAVNLKESRRINYSALRELVRLLLDGDKRSPELIIDENGWRLITDKTIINKFVEECMIEHSDIVNKYCSAKEKKKKNVWTNLLIQVNKDERTEKLDMSIMSQLLLQALEKQRNINQENKLKSP